MSGPKCAHYEVVDAAEIERRAHKAASDRILHAVAAFGRLAADTEHARIQWGETIDPAEAPRLAVPAGSQAATALAEKLERHLRQAEARLEEQVRSARKAAIGKRLAAARGSTGTTRGRRVTAADRPDQSERASAADVGPTQDDVERIVGRLRGDVDDAVAEAVAAHAAEILRTDNPVRAATLLSALRTDVQRGNEQAAERHTNRVAVNALLTELAGCHDDTCDRLRERLDGHLSAGTGATEALRREVRTAAEAARARADRSFALDVTTQCLRDLGYEVEKSFDTLLAEDGVAEVRRGEWPGYAVRLRVDEAEGTLNFNVVRSEGAPAITARDVEVETSWCEDYAALAAEASTAGVELTMLRHEAPGARPVQVVSDRPAARRRHTPITRSHES